MQQFSQDYKFVDGIFLLKLTTPIHPSLIAMSQGVQNLSEDIKAFEFCTPTSGLEYKKECTFVFNKDDIFYYTLYFFYHQEVYELIIKSYHQCAYFFLDFLKQFYLALTNNKIGYEPNNVFNLAKTLISGWPTTLENKMDIVYPTNIQSIEFTNSDFSFDHFKPSNFFQPKVCSEILAHLFSMKPILLVAPDAITACKACFSALSLLHPLRYIDPMILWLRKEDPRYSEIMKSDCKSPYLIVATDDAAELNSKFDLVVNCSKMYKINPKQDNKFQKLVQNILLMIQGEFVNLLNRNPYSDVLNLPWAEKNMESIVNKLKFMPCMDILKSFEKMKTVKYWRLRRSKNSKFRDVLLQNGEMQFNKYSQEQLLIIYNFLKSIKGNYESDIHLNAVIKKHKLIVSKLLVKSNANMNNCQ